MRPAYRLSLLLAAWLATAELTGASPAAELIGQASVIDGDTIEIHGQRIRFFGIDALESHQTCEAGQQTYRCGQQAALALADHIGQQTVSCEERDVDRYAHRRRLPRRRRGPERLDGEPRLCPGVPALQHSPMSARRTQRTPRTAASGAARSRRRGIGSMGRARHPMRQRQGKRQ